MLDVEIGNFFLPSRRRGHASNICKHADSSFLSFFFFCYPFLSLSPPGVSLPPLQRGDMNFRMRRIENCFCLQHLLRWDWKTFFLPSLTKTTVFSDPYIHAHSCRHARVYLRWANIFVFFAPFLFFIFIIVVNPKSTFYISRRIYSKRIFFGQIDALKNARIYIYTYTRRIYCM